PDLDKRIDALAPLARNELAFARDGALDALGRVGPKALPALRAYLATPTPAPGPALKALVVAAGSGAPGELAAIIRDEHAFWKSVAPTLEVDWWNGRRSDREVLRQRYLKLLGALWELRPIATPAVRAPVKALRDFWHAQPALEEGRDLTEMTEA